MIRLPSLIAGLALALALASALTLAAPACEFEAYRTGEANPACAQLRDTLRAARLKGEVWPALYRQGDWAQWLGEDGYIRLPASQLQPVQLRELYDALAICAHLAGEIGGDGSERDAEVMQQMKRCESVELSLKRLLQQHPDDAAVKQLQQEFNGLI